VEDDARGLTGEGVNRVSELGQTYLPEGVERSRRVFVPEAMFNSRRNRDGRRSAIVAGGVYGLGIGLSQRQDLVEANFQDIFDIHYRFLSYFDGGKEGARADDESVSTLGIVSVGLGTVSVIGGGKVFGIRGVIESIARICDIFSNERSRRWAVPVLGIATAGLAMYLVLDLPTAIPRTVGRHIKATLVHPADDHISSPLVTPRLTFTMYHSQRMQKETRKVIRIASWDLRDRFKTAMENSQKEVKGAEEMEARADRAAAWFREVQSRTDAVREKADLASVF
jgi:mitofusin